jgi:hypothetical protein
MKKHDHVDQARARALTWQALRTSASASTPEPDAGGSPENALEKDAWRQEALASCQQLADAIARVWARSDPALQARDTAGLFETARELDRKLSAMQLHPLACVRLARLAVRHHPCLKPEAQDAACWTCFHLDYAHPEAEELVIELLEREMWELGGSVHESLRQSTRRPPLANPHLLDRLRCCIAGDASWTAKMMALSFCVFVPYEPLLPTLRQALRLPHLGVRWRALAVLIGPPTDEELPLLADPASCWLSEEELLFLLEDAVAHPPVASQDPITQHSALQYARVLAQATRRLRPAAGARPLERILDNEGSSVWWDRQTLDDGWAFSVLALAYPELAMPRIDQSLGAVETEERRIALYAASCLSKEQARPRFLRAMTDGACAVVQAARECAEAVLGESWPLDPLAALPHPLLTSPPSERLRQRSLQLFTEDDGVRQQLVETLLAEAPDREALALFMRILVDDPLLEGLEGFDASAARWRLCDRLMDAFGPVALDAILGLVERYPGLSRERCFLGFLCNKAEAGVFPSSGPGSLKDLALRQLDDPKVLDPSWALHLLAQLGLPVERYDRVFAWIAEGGPCWWAAVQAAREQNDPALLGRLAIAAKTAFEAQDFARCDRFLCVLKKHEDPAFLSWVEQIAQEYVRSAAEAREADPSAASWPLDPAAYEVVRSCALILLNQGRLPAGWRDAALARPEHRCFQLATMGLVETAGLSESQLAALRPVLASPARDGCAAAEAAAVLLHQGQIDPSEPHLLAIVERAHGVARLEALMELLKRYTTARPLRGPLRALLTSEDPDDQDFVNDHLLMGSDLADLDELLCETLPEVRAAPLRDLIEQHLQLPTELHRYWQDAK